MPETGFSERNNLRKNPADVHSATPPVQNVEIANVKHKHCADLHKIPLDL